MSVFFLAKLGYILWEALMLVLLAAASLGWLMLRRKMSGRPVFSNRDRALLFNTPPVAPSVPRLCLRFAAAVCLFAPIGALEIFALAPLGAAILSVCLLFSCAAIVNLTVL